MKDWTEERMAMLISETLGIERRRCIDAVRAEPEYPSIEKDRARYEDFLRKIQELIEIDLGMGTYHFADGVLRKSVRDTKEGIERRINGTTTTNQGAANAEGEGS